MMAEHLYDVIIRKGEMLSLCGQYIPGAAERTCAGLDHRALTTISRIAACGDKMLLRLCHNDEVACTPRRRNVCTMSKKTPVGRAL